MNVTPARFTLIAVVIVLLAVYAIVIRPLEATIAMRDADVDEARTGLERELALATRLPALEAEDAARRARFSHLHLHEARAQLLDRFLHQIARAAERDRVTVQTIAGSTPLLALGAARSDTALLDEETLDVTFRGAYSDAIRAVRDVNGGEIPARIALASLGRADVRPGAQPLLNVAIHVTLLREADEARGHGPAPL